MVRSPRSAPGAIAGAHAVASLSVGPWRCKPKPRPKCSRCRDDEQPGRDGGARAGRGGRSASGIPGALRPWLRLCTALSGEKDVAEDIVQEAFVRVADKIASLRSDEIGPYLRRVVVNLWKNKLRRLGVEMRHRVSPRSDHLAEDEIESRDAIWTALLRLSGRQRACLVLRFYEGLAEREVAEVLGCSVGTVGSGVGPRRVVSAPFSSRWRSPPGASWVCGQRSAVAGSLRDRRIPAPSQIPPRGSARRSTSVSALGVRWPPACSELEACGWRAPGGGATDATVVRIDPVTDRVVARIPIQSVPSWTLAGTAWHWALGRSG